MVTLAGCGPDAPAEEASAAETPLLGRVDASWSPTEAVEAIETGAVVGELACVAARFEDAAASAAAEDAVLVGARLTRAALAARVARLGERADFAAAVEAARKRCAPPATSPEAAAVELRRRLLELNVAAGCLERRRLPAAETAARMVAAFQATGVTMEEYLREMPHRSSDGGFQREVVAGLAGCDERALPELPEPSAREADPTGIFAGTLAGDAEGTFRFTLEDRSVRDGHAELAGVSFTLTGRLLEGRRFELAGKARTSTLHLTGSIRDDRVRVSGSWSADLRREALDGRLDGRLR